MRKSIAAAIVVGLAPLAVGAAIPEEWVEALERSDAEIYHTLEEEKAAGGKGA
jgi:hypothetical protein